MTRKNTRKSKAKPIGPPETKKPRKEAKKDLAKQVIAEAPPPAESPKTATTPEPMDASATPARSMQPKGPQCFKCQRWGHVSYTCKNDTRCVKCALGHRAAECTKKAEDPCCCANCGGSHPASYRGCAAAPKTRRRRSKPKSKQQDQGREKGVISKLANVLCKLMLTKDFFSEAQLDIISQEMDEKPKSQSSHASTQTNFELVTPSRSIETSTDDLQPLPMETDPETSNTKVPTDTIRSATTSSTASQTPAEFRVRGTAPEFPANYFRALAEREHVFNRALPFDERMRLYDSYKLNAQEMFPNTAEDNLTDAEMQLLQLS